MEKDNDKVIKITKGKIKLAGLLLGLTLTAAGGYAISKSGSSEKEQLSVETEVDLEDEIKTEENVVLADEIIVEEILDDGIYQKDEIDSLYLAFTLKSDEINVITVKEVSISDICAIEITNNKDITYGEYYLGDDCYSIFKDGSTKDNNNIKLYISVPENILINVVNYRSPIKDARYLSNLAKKTEEELLIDPPFVPFEEKRKNLDILGSFNLIKFEPIVYMYTGLKELPVPNKVSDDDLLIYKNYFVEERDVIFDDPTKYEYSEPDGYIAYTKKR